jgi:hypothetical protein
MEGSYQQDVAGSEPIATVINRLDCYNVRRVAIRDFLCEYVQQHGKNDEILNHSILSRGLDDLSTEDQVWALARMIWRALDIHQSPIDERPYIKFGERYMNWLDRSTQMYGEGDALKKRCEANTERGVVTDGPLQHFYGCSDLEFVDPCDELLRVETDTILEYVDPHLRRSLDEECYIKNRRSEVIEELELIFTGMVPTGVVPSITHQQALKWGEKHLTDLGV